MIQEYQLRILPEIAASEQQLKAYLSQEKGLNQRDITALRTLKRSIDARQRTIYVNLKVRVYLNEMPKDDEYEHTIYNNVEGKPQVIVVGAGPGGLFAALRLIELGLRPVVVERGKDVRERKKDLAQISREHRVTKPRGEYSAFAGWRVNVRLVCGNAGRYCRYFCLGIAIARWRNAVERCGQTFPR